MQSRGVVSWLKLILLVLPLASTGVRADDTAAPPADASPEAISGIAPVSIAEPTIESVILPEAAATATTAADPDGETENHSAEPTVSTPAVADPEPAPAVGDSAVEAGEPGLEAADSSPEVTDLVPGAANSAPQSASMQAIPIEIVLPTSHLQGQSLRLECRTVEGDRLVASRSLVATTTLQIVMPPISESGGGPLSLNCTLVTCADAACGPVEVAEPPARLVGVELEQVLPSPSAPEGTNPFDYDDLQVVTRLPAEADVVPASGASPSPSAPAASLQGAGETAGRASGSCSEAGLSAPDPAVEGCP